MRYFIPTLRVAIFPTLLLGFASASCRDFSPRDAGQPIILKPTPIPPMQALEHDAIFTPTNEIRGLNWDGKTLWAASAGGVLAYQKGMWTKWDRRNGLPSHEAQSLWRDKQGVHVRFPVHESTFSNGKLETKAVPIAPALERKAIWRGEIWKATLTGLQSPKKKVTLPPESTGTHISALIADGDALLVALYGDGLWRWDGKWTRDSRSNSLPENAHEVTALAGDAKHLWLGTRRDGVFHFMNGKWTPLPIQNEPISANIQNLAFYHGVLWASTLEDGLVFRGGKGWGQVTPPQLSSNAPRHLVEFQNRLYVRHGTGIVDCYDGASWQKNALKDIPRRGVYALDANDKTLVCAGWGGWSEWNGQNWTAHYDIPELKGVPLVGVSLQENVIWFATQSRGVGRYDRASGEFRFYDERDGLPDDWITSLLVDGKTVWAGTFIGGLAHFDGEKWQITPGFQGQNVTSLAKDGEGGVYVATRRGLSHVSETGEVKTVGPAWLDSEQQVLLHTSDGLWIGTRTSLDFWRSSIPVNLSVEPQWENTRAARTDEHAATIAR